MEELELPIVDPPNRQKTIAGKGKRGAHAPVEPDLCEVRFPSVETLLALLGPLREARYWTRCVSESLLPKKVSSPEYVADRVT